VARFCAMKVKATLAILPINRSMICITEVIIILDKSGEMWERSKHHWHRPPCFYFDITGFHSLAPSTHPSARNFSKKSIIPIICSGSFPDATTEAFFVNFAYTLAESTLAFEFEVSPASQHSSLQFRKVPYSITLPRLFGGV
jgi:hypothetical protein